jgi:hypothetical protein
MEGCGIGEAVRRDQEPSYCRMMIHKVLPSYKLPVILYSPRCEPPEILARFKKILIVVGSDEAPDPGCHVDLFIWFSRRAFSSSLSNDGPGDEETTSSGTSDDV